MTSLQKIWGQIRMTVRDGEAPALRAARLRKTSLDKDLRKIERMEEATRFVSRTRFAPGFALLFLVTAGIFASFQIGSESNALLIMG